MSRRVPRYNQDVIKERKKILKIIFTVATIVGTISVAWEGEPLILLNIFYAVKKGTDKMLEGSLERVESRKNLTIGILANGWPVFLVAIVSNYLPDRINDILFSSLWDVLEFVKQV